MARNALRGDDVSWLLRTVKIQQCVAFGCSNQAKNRKDTSISFHVFPKNNRLRRAWIIIIQAVGRTSLQKVPVCFRSISLMLIASNTRLDFRMSCLDRALGSENLNLRLFPRSSHTNQPDLYLL